MDATAVRVAEEKDDEQGISSVQPRFIHHEGHDG
jgi:hypothetical protein